jgi:hypothetical protein
MRRLFIVAAICVIAAPAIASPDLLRYSMAGTLNYDLETGQAIPANGERVLGPHIWGPTTRSGWFSSMPLAGNDIWLDWADLGDKGYNVGGFGWSYATNANHGSIDLLLAFYGDDNGWNNTDANGNPIAQRHILIVWSLTGLNGTITPANRSNYWGWTYRGEVNTPWTMSANDVDGDGLGDFSYTYWFDMTALEGPPSDPSPIVGPVIAGYPNTDDIPGAEDVFDIFNEPNYVPQPGYIDPNLTHYIGTYWFGGVIYAQFYMELFAPGCPNRGEAGRYCTADIDGSFDCIVSLSDLAQLLGNYGCGVDPNDICTQAMGDIDPYDRWFPGDGVIGLGDLAELLGQYGDNCNWPQP